MNLSEMDVEPDSGRPTRVTQRRRAGIFGAASRRRYASLGVVLASCFGLALFVAACGGSPTPSPGSTSAYDQDLAYSQCMRAHGIADFPDPQRQTDGGASLPSISPHGDLDPNNPQAHAALQACQSLRPTGVGAQQPPNQEAMQKALELSQCMRTHGFPDYPDPQFTGGAKPGLDLSGTGIDQQSPAFQAALHTCQSILDNGGSGSGAAPSATNQP